MQEAGHRDENHIVPVSEIEDCDGKETGLDFDASEGKGDFSLVDEEGNCFEYSK